LAAEANVFRAIDHAHAALTHDPEHPVVRQRLADQHPWERGRLARRFVLPLKLGAGRPRSQGLRQELRRLSQRGGHKARPYVFHRNHQPVAPAGYGLDIFRVLRRVPKGVPQSLDGGVDAVVELYDGVVRPEPLLQLFARYHVAWTLYQHLKNAKRLFLKADSAPVPVQFTRLEIQFEGPQTDDM